MNIIGNFLKKIRKDKDIKVVTLAKQIGISQPYISNIENGKRTVTKELFFKIIYGIAELSPITWDVYYDLELAEEQKVEVLVFDTITEFWDKYSDEIKKDLNRYLDDGKPISTLEDFKDRVQSWPFEDMMSISGYSDFLDSKYGVGNYGGYIYYDDFSSYTNQEYVQEIVLDYWYQSILSEFMELFEVDLSAIETKTETETNRTLLNNLGKQEFEIYLTVKNLRSKTGHFARYHLQEENKDKLVDLNILDDQDSIHNITLDSKPLSEEDIISLRNTLNGIRYSK